MRRANNQDSMAVLMAGTLDRFYHHGHLFVVADGMGAHAAGELASRLAVEHIAMQYFRSAEEDCPEALRIAVRESNAEIHRRGQQNPEFYNMGTTASSLAILPVGAVVAHVGDSRVYRLRDRVLEQLTFDHSLVWEMEASGQIHPDSVLGQSIPKNVITRSLGPNANVEVDLEGPFEIHANDQFLLCSDGLSGQVEDEEIAAIMDCLPANLATRVLVDLANLRGGPDNSTVIIVRVEADFAEVSGKSTVAKRPRRRREPSAVSPLLMGTAAICFLGSLGLGLAMAVLNTPVSKALGPMIIAFILGMIASAFCVAQYIQSKPKCKAKPLPKTPGGKGPYRRYSANPSKELFDRLGKTVEELRSAASQRNWMMDWGKIDELQQKGSVAVAQAQFKTAIRLQAEAIIETMHQLRELNNRAANETDIER
ncbi:PP2C family protein-serine/threonine phosphatase [Novipirellula galeiformis]|nr:protein phosphatase 2C domain-containing protein [Novipirellula galeiformis]